MKLTTYNFLTSKAIKGVKVGYPLLLSISKRVYVETEYNPIFIERLLPKMDWPTLYLSAQAVEMGDDIPAEQPTSLTDNDELLRKLHSLLLEIDILEGQLECPETGRIFPITDGIPNMLLNEDEV